MGKAQNKRTHTHTYLHRQNRRAQQTHCLNAAETTIETSNWKRISLAGKLIIPLQQNKSEWSKSIVNRSSRKTLPKVFGNLNPNENKTMKNETTPKTKKKERQKKKNE